MPTVNTGVPGTWPCELPSFVGRRRELGEVKGLLAASRLVLYPVAPLPTPAPSVADVARYDSVVLFLARAILPDFALTDANGAAVAELCRRRDGLPLAIELAAARVRTLEPRQILDRLVDRFGLLSRGSRDAPARQQALRACVEWSFSLCGKPERLLWARLSVFVGGFELDAVEGVCADESLPAGDLLDVLTGLIEKSIVDRVGAGDGTGEQARYRYRNLHRGLRPADLRLSRGDPGSTVLPAELPGAMLLMLEHAPANRRGLTAAINNVASVLATAFAATFSLILARLLSPEQLADWGWRVAFLIAAPIGLVGLYVRTRLLDNPVFVALGLTGAVIGQALCSVFVGPAYSVGAVLAMTLFPTGIRFTAFAVPLSVATALFGSTAPFASTWLTTLTHSPLAPGFYLLGAAAVGTLAVVVGLWPGMTER